MWGAESEAGLGFVSLCMFRIYTSTGSFYHPAARKATLLFLSTHAHLERVQIFVKYAWYFCPMKLHSLHVTTSTWNLSALTSLKDSSAIFNLRREVNRMKVNVGSLRLHLLHFLHCSLKQGWTFCSNTFCLCCVGDGKMELIGKHTFTCTCHKPRFMSSDPFGRYFDDHDWQPRGRRPPYLCCSAHSWEEDETCCPSVYI